MYVYIDVRINTFEFVYDLLLKIKSSGYIHVYITVELNILILSIAEYMLSRCEHSKNRTFLKCAHSEIVLNRIK